MQNQPEPAQRVHERKLQPTHPIPALVPCPALAI